MGKSIFYVSLLAVVCFRRKISQKWLRLQSRCWMQLTRISFDAIIWKDNFHVKWCSSDGGKLNSKVVRRYFSVCARLRFGMRKWCKCGRTPDQRSWLSSNIAGWEWRRSSHISSVTSFLVGRHVFLEHLHVFRWNLEHVTGNIWHVVPSVDLNWLLSATLHALAF
jgi:hypothetical protein